MIRFFNVPSSELAVLVAVDETRGGECAKSAEWPQFVLLDDKNDDACFHNGFG